LRIARIASTVSIAADGNDESRRLFLAQQGAMSGKLVLTLAFRIEGVPVQGLV